MIREYDEWFLPYSKIFHEVTQDRRSHDMRHRHVLVHGKGVTTIAAAPPMLPAHRPGRSQSAFLPSPRAIFKCELATQRDWTRTT
jgi:hypothetical protein